MPVKFPSNLVHSNASFPVIAAADQTIQGLFFVADTTERGNIPETKRVEGSIAVVGSTVEVYNGTGVSDAAWQDVKNWVEVGGTETGADLDVVGVRASTLSDVVIGGQTVQDSFPYQFEDNPNADAETSALVYRELEGLIPDVGDEGLYRDSSGKRQVNDPKLTFVIGANVPLFNGGPAVRVGVPIHLTNMFGPWSNSDGALANHAFPFLTGGTVGRRTFKSTYALADRTEAAYIDKRVPTYSTVFYVTKDRHVSATAGLLKQAMSNGIDGGTF